MDAVIRALYIERALVLNKFNANIMSVKLDWQMKEMVRVEATSPIMMGPYVAR